jgi:hypothetical protein
MPLVFVHGVSVRRNGDYDKVVSRRDSLFRRFALKQLVPDWETFDIKNPYWGDDAAQFRWRHASLPKGDEEVLGGVDGEMAVMLAESGVKPSAPDRAVVETARKAGLTAAVDLLWSVGSHTGREDLSQELAGLAYEALVYARANPNPSWLGQVSDDQEFVTALRREIRPTPQPQSTGKPQAKREVLGGTEVWESLREAAGRIATAVPAAMSSVALSISRSSLHRAIATFLGDVMVYLHQRDKEGDSAAIPKRVLADLDAADEIRKRKSEPMIIVCHSMGGNIIYDILTQFRKDFAVDMLVTVGSQPALLEELKLLAASNPNIPSASVSHAPAPPATKKWINIFDTNDILSFAASRVFEKVSDYQYSTGQDVFHAHSSYFNRPSFQERIGARIEEAWSK